MVLASAAVVVLVVLAWSAMDHDGAAPVAAAARAPAPRGPQFFGQVQAEGLPLPDDRASRRRQLVENVQLADHTYCSYRASTQYPAGSRPMTDNPDQNRPNDPVASMNPMRLDGGGSEGRVQLQTSQSRVYMASGEAVAFSLRAVDAEGKTLPLVITRALAQGITYRGARQTPQVSIPFVDDGTGADPVPNDGAFAGVLAPAQTGLASFNGTIRTEVRYNVGGKSGVVQFDVIYTPELPAVWAGAPREAVEEGSLVFHLPLEVRMPGRYIINGRVDDARGHPVALLTFNDVLGPGPNDVRLTVFGKLLRDQSPPLPLTLRDVDGYLLKENTDPDRALVPRLQGKVLTAAAHSPKSFSDAEWQSEERSRYLTEFGKDLREARARLAAFDPTSPPPPSECMPATR
nr:choice-of-anchor X domain-containing protein [Massilia rhizosphaerae]